MYMFYLKVAPEKKNVVCNKLFTLFMMLTEVPDPLWRTFLCMMQVNFKIYQMNLIFFIVRHICDSELDLIIQLEFLHWQGFLLF